MFLIRLKAALPCWLAGHAWLWKGYAAYKTPLSVWLCAKCKSLQVKR